jgi:hypothetical protein
MGVLKRRMPSGVMQPGCVFEQYLSTMERVRSPQERIGAPQLLSRAQPFLQRRWIVPDGHLSHIPVPVFDDEIDVEVEIDEDAGTFSYTVPGYRPCKLTQALEEIAVYSFNVQAWLDDLAGLLGIEPARRARRSTVIESHLWHLGDLRVGRSHRFAPIYVGRLLEKCDEDWRAALQDPIRPPQGIVLAMRIIDAHVPSAHQVRALVDLLLYEQDGYSCDLEMLERLLQGPRPEGDEPGEFFDEGTGTLRLSHMAAPRSFIGIQKQVIALFWKERQQPHLKWSEVKIRVDCGKDLDTVFGKGVWAEWIQHVGRGLYRLNTTGSAIAATQS